jgi:hypothetical protein
MPRRPSSADVAQRGQHEERPPPPPKKAHAPGRFLPCSACAKFQRGKPPDAQLSSPTAQFLTLVAHFLATISLSASPIRRRSRAPPGAPPPSPNSLRSAPRCFAEVSSFLLSSLHRSPPRRSLAATEARLSRPGRPRLPSSGRPQHATSSAIAAASRFTVEPRPARRSRVAVRSLHAQLDPMPLVNVCAASTAEPNPNQRAAVCPAPRARSTVAVVASHGDRTAEPDPAGVIAQLVRTLAFVCAQCVDRTPSTFAYPSSIPRRLSSTPRLPPSTPVYPSSNLRVRSCRLPSPAHRTLNRRMLFVRVARAVRTCRHAFYAR